MQPRPNTHHHHPQVQTDDDGPPRTHERRVPMDYKRPWTETDERQQVPPPPLCLSPLPDEDVLYLYEFSTVPYDIALV
ncbi:hypothetical protein K443DRAFT_12785 [Laccaria amethystina LaAM-08-1]|uniref:Uncharacterized protein n=1 Tax=Laccaria amethystina LaAM-08-1 TaxID=1095629 RepID=A0A0C9WXH3_9AGAR|nr:hypothetical protein K443DRAFT_12785 [Laccaria amethystina LaAM-08-1]